MRSLLCAFAILALTACQSTDNEAITYVPKGNAWASTGVQSQPVSTADAAAQEVVAADATDAAAPAAEAAAEEATVAAADTSCALEADLTSPAAVGAPCSTTEAFIRSLNLSAEQTAKALDAVRKAAAAH